MAVIDSAQPYHGAHFPSRAIKALRDLSNRDKHRVLNPPLLTTMGINFSDAVPAHRGGELVIPDPPERLKADTEIVRVPFPPDVDAEMEMAGYVFPGIRLPEWDESIMFGVDSMKGAVKLIVFNIEAEL
ncbi:MAG: hypothetical protein M3N45_01575 [Actinomycetota bacterium]|nr:hypothetical protein [Actinomycetota bacterium]